MTQQFDGMPEATGPPPSDRDADKFALQVLYCLQAPRIGYGRGRPTWPEVLERHSEEITVHRLAHAVEIHKQEECTELEAMLYISTATMEMPLADPWYHIYVWLFRRWKPDAAAQIFDEYELNRELGIQEQQELRRLRRDIYRDQMRHLKAKLRGEPAADEEPAEDGVAPNRAERRRREREARKEVQATQQPLF